MECNKEEAIRAKDIAQIKMQNKDFATSRKIVLRAQRLYSDLENLSQMLTICDVHCAAEQKLFGAEMDWYGILQIQQIADETMIKKQYKKLALQLHPDKNKFPGAEAAFKLIGEAQAVLLDKNKRSLHDHKRKCSVNKPAAPQTTAQRTTPSTNVGFQNNSWSSFMAKKPAAQQGFPNVNSTFLTVCPFCNTRYQFHREFVNRNAICQACSKSFIAYERSMQGVPMVNKFNQPVFSKKPDVSSQGTGRVNVGSQGTGTGSTNHFKTEVPQKRSGTGFAAHSETEVPQKKSGAPEYNSQNANNKKQKKEEASSSEKCGSDCSDETDEEVFLDKDDEFKAEVRIDQREENPRRSSRRRQNVSYAENMSDDEDFETNPKEVKVKDSSSLAQEGEIGKGRMSKSNGDNVNRVKETEKKKVEKNTSGENSEVYTDLSFDPNGDSDSDQVFYSCPDPEFYDFDKDRRADCFSVDQIWAVYDDLDAMPRFYARVRKVFPTEFKLRITWLEPDPEDEKEIKWVSEGLPAACGKFKQGNSQNTADRLMFSHLVCWTKGIRGGSYKVFPCKGEVWALFKNWDIRWEVNDNQKLKFEFEFVEVREDYSVGLGVSVGYLGKIRGFRCVFCKIRKDGAERTHIPHGELFRFSHRVPSFGLTGEEREGVPKGSFELDPASLSENIEEIDITEDNALKIDNFQAQDPSSGPSE